MFCRDKSLLDKHKLVATSILLSRQYRVLSRQTRVCRDRQTRVCFDATKILLVAALANDRVAGTALPTPV